MCINQNLIPEAHVDVAHEQGQTSKITDEVRTVRNKNLEATLWLLKL
jgi:hypothetical protein